jgi:hypothetical protein
LEEKRIGSGLDSRDYGRGDPLRRARGTLYPQKLALTSPTSDGRSVGIVRSRTQATEFSFFSEISCGGVDWITATQDGDQWQALAYTVRNHRFP